MPEETPSAPLAYLITFTSYGTWLHGDPRKSVDRHHRRFSVPRIPSHVGRLHRARTELARRPVLLDAAARSAVRAAIVDTVEHRSWRLLAMNVRTNHVHTVVSAPVPPEHVANALKANATRVMRERGLWQESASPWTKGASTRYLWNSYSVECAVNYVLYRQGPDLP
ncbi:MAG TPA: transposase [Blastocatellia bacterium]|nr:transposase [Blastocatellia bacterium]